MIGVPPELLFQILVLNLSNGSRDTQEKHAENVLKTVQHTVLHSMAPEFCPAGVRDTSPHTLHTVLRVRPHITTESDKVLRVRPHITTESVTSTSPHHYSKYYEYVTTSLHTVLRVRPHITTESVTSTSLISTTDIVTSTSPHHYRKCYEYFPTSLQKVLRVRPHITTESVT